MLNFLKRLFSEANSNSSLPSGLPLANANGKIVAARVKKIEKHLNADRLRVIHLTDGQSEIGPVVCGAFNFQEKDMVVLALPGATIAQNIHSDTHEGFILDKATIRGIESQGMICSAFELGLAPQPEDKPEIMILPPVVAPGAVLG